MRGKKTTEWFFRLLFPTVLIGVIIYSVVVQPPLISSPQIKASFAEFGSRPGYFEQVGPKSGPKSEPWPAGLHPLLKRALTGSFGQDRPRIDSFYYFGTAEQRLWGLAAPVGFETLLKPGQGYSRQTGLSAFNFHFALWQTGMMEDRSWSKKNGKPKQADRKAAQAAFILEQAALLLPLIDSGLTFAEAGPDRLKARLKDGRTLELEFSGARLSRAGVEGAEIRTSGWQRFGAYTLPSLWTGRWGQAGLSEMEILGLVFNPPFADEALAEAAQ